MALNLLNSYGTKGINYGLSTKKADVIDTQYLSQYFIVSEFDPTFTAGRNSFAFNGSTYLKSGSEIFIECLDSGGNNLYIEQAKSSTTSVIYAYKISTTFIFSIHVYNDTPEGVGSIILYGTLTDGKSVKWKQNITINKTLKNDSIVRFYQTPTMEVSAADVPVLSDSVSSTLINNVTFTGTVQGLAINPIKNTNLASINKRNTEIDYRLTLISPVVTNATIDSQAFNSQMIGSMVTLNIHTIKSPTSQEPIPISSTASYVISNVLNNNTLQISDPYYYKDAYGNNSITDIINADFLISYPFVNYNTTTSSYQKSFIGGVPYFIKQSYADIIYRNIRTFSGYVARHKIYRKSLLSNSDFSVVADEPITANEVLVDNLTQNKNYDLLGKFYNDEHIARYWFTSSNNISLIHSPSIAIDSMFFSSPSYTSLSGSDYIMVKNDSVPLNRNARYIPFDMGQFLSESGSAYDSNFMELKSNVQYIIEISTTIIKNSQETNAGLSFYFTSSVPNAQKEPFYTQQFGVEIANITASTAGVSTSNFNNFVTFFTPQNDLYGTLVIVPYFCQAYIKNISFRVYGDDGFSPDAFVTRIPWPISVANECFDIKAELFGVNGNLIYSGLEAFENFDPSGSTLIPFIPGSGDYQNLIVSGSLYVSKSIIVQGGDVYIPNIVARPGVPDLNQTRIVSVRADGALVFDPIIDATSDDKYLYLTLDNASSRTDTSGIYTRKSLASEYTSSIGRKIYWVSGVKVIESGP